MQPPILTFGLQLFMITNYHNLALQKYMQLGNQIEEEKANSSSIPHGFCINTSNKKERISLYPLKWQTK